MKLLALINRARATLAAAASGLGPETLPRACGWLRRAGRDAPRPDRLGRPRLALAAATVAVLAAAVTAISLATGPGAAPPAGAGAPATGSASARPPPDAAPPGPGAAETAADGRPGTASAPAPRPDRPIPAPSAPGPAAAPVPAGEFGPAPDLFAPVPGSTCASAAQLGDISGAQGSVGLAFERSGNSRQSRAVGFRLGSAGRVEFALSDPAAGAGLFLYNDRARRLTAGPAGDRLAAWLPGGAYCLHALADKAYDREIELSYAVSDDGLELERELAARAAAVELRVPGKSGGPAMAEGVAGGHPAPADYFRFTLAEPGRVVLAASQLDADASITLEDRTGGVVATRIAPGSARVAISATLLAGTYFVRVQSETAAPDGYRLSISAYRPTEAAVAELTAAREARWQSPLARIESLLLPDLVSDPPESAGQTHAVVTPEGDELLALTFGGYVANLGSGPLELAGNPQLADPEDPTSHGVWQNVLSESGEWVRLAKPPVRYETSDGHSHFHLLEIVAYSLWDETGTVPIKPGAKVGFCLLDFEELGARHPGPPAQRYSEADVADCMAYRPDATALRMGISEGWRDYYGPEVPFQWVDVSDVAPGRYRVGAEADPFDIVAESDEANNGLALAGPVSVVPGFVAQPQVARTDPGAAVRIELGSARFGQPGPIGHRIVDFPENGTLRTGYDFAVNDPDGFARQGFFSPVVTYTPDDGFAGVDKFTFAAFDAWRPQYPTNPVIATVTVDVSGLAPAVAIRGAPDSIDAGATTTLTASLSGAGPGVDWAVIAPAGAEALFGSIDADGRYRAPAQAPPGGKVTIRAASRSAPAAYAEATLEVRAAGNTAPVAFAPDTVEAAVGERVDVWVAASDAQRGRLAWRAENLPPGLRIVHGTGRIVGSPTRAGTWQSTISVGDGQLVTTASIAWSIA